MFASFRDGFRRYFQRTTRPQRRSTFQLQIEQLEAREVPAVYRVTALTDSTPGAVFTALGTGTAANPFHGPNLTVRMALENANGSHASENDMIILTGGATYTINQGQLLANLSGNHTLTMTTAGAGRAVLQAVQGFTSTSFRVIQVNGSTVGKFNNLVFTGGLEFGQGGGINNFGTLTLTNSVVRGNEAVGSEQSGVFGGGIYNEGTLTLDASTVSGNIVDGIPSSPNGLFFGAGGGIFDSNSLTLKNGSVVSGNKVQSKFAAGGGIAESSGDLSLSASRVTGNTAQGNFVSTSVNTTTKFSSLALGGGICDFGGSTITITGCTVANNNARGGDFNDTGFETAGVADGGGLASGLPFSIGSSDITISHSTFSNNHAIGGNSDSTSGGAAAGGGISLVAFHSFLMIDSTVSGNSAQGGTTTADDETVTNGSGVGGGIFSTGSSEGGTTGRLVNVTVSNNQAVGGNDTTGKGGGIDDEGDSLALWNTIVAQNFADAARTEALTIGSDVSGTFISTGVLSGHNLIGSADGSTGFGGAGSHDIVGTSTHIVNAKLGPLANNGGPTQTQALLAGSLAIDAGDDAVLGFFDPATLTNVTTDQRYLPRKSGAHVDIGAYEVQPSTGINRRWNR